MRDKRSHKTSLKLYLVFGVGSSVFLFYLHWVAWPTAMNPLAFIVCSSPLVLSSPGLLMLDEDFDNNGSQDKEGR